MGIFKFVNNKGHETFISSFGGKTMTTHIAKHGEEKAMMLALAKLKKLQADKPVRLNGKKMLVKEETVWKDKTLPLCSRLTWSACKAGYHKSPLLCIEVRLADGSLFKRGKRLKRNGVYSACKELLPFLLVHTNCNITLEMFVSLVKSKILLDSPKYNFNVDDIVDFRQKEYI